MGYRVEIYLGGGRYQLVQDFEQEADARAYLAAFEARIAHMPYDDLLAEGLDRDEEFRVFYKSPDEYLQEEQKWLRWLSPDGCGVMSSQEPELHEILQRLERHEYVTVTAAAGEYFQYSVTPAGRAACAALEAQGA